MVNMCSGYKSQVVQKILILNKYYMYTVNMMFSGKMRQNRSACLKYIIKMYLKCMQEVVFHFYNNLKVTTHFNLKNLSSD